MVEDVDGVECDPEASLLGMEIVGAEGRPSAGPAAEDWEVPALARESEVVLG